jgi:hypothetical protein
MRTRSCLPKYINLRNPLVNEVVSRVLFISKRFRNYLCSLPFYVLQTWFRVASCVIFKKQTRYSFDNKYPPRSI